MENRTVPKTMTYKQASSPQAVDDIYEAVTRSFDRSFERLGPNKKSVLSTFETALEGLRKAKNPETRLRSIAKSAALSTGRCHGNVMDTGRCLLDSLDSLSTKHGFKPEVARDQIILGLAEGTCQLGPVVYCRFLDVANTYKEGADEWIARNRRLPAILDSSEHPVIVPYEAGLTLKSVAKPQSPRPVDREEVPIPAPQPKTETIEWSRTKQPSIFRRLTEAVGHFFGG